MPVLALFCMQNASKQTFANVSLGVSINLEKICEQIRFSVSISLLFAET